MLRGEKDLIASVQTKLCSRHGFTLKYINHYCTNSCCYSLNKS